MFGGPSERQDHSSTSHWVRQLSIVLRAKNGTRLGVRKLCSSLYFATDPLYSLILGKAERNNDLLKYHSQSWVSRDRNMYYSRNIHIPHPTPWFPSILETGR